MAQWGASFFKTTTLDDTWYFETRHSRVLPSQISKPLLLVLLDNLKSGRCLVLLGEQSKALPTLGRILKVL